MQRRRLTPGRSPSLRPPASASHPSPTPLGARGSHHWPDDRRQWQRARTCCTTCRHDDRRRPGLPFQGQGLDITIAAIDFAGGSRALQALVGNGSADVVSGAFEHDDQHAGQGASGSAPSRCRAEGAANRRLGINPKTMPNFKSVADHLKGKKLGVTAPGSSTNVLANFVLAKVGLKPGDVSIIGVGTGLAARSRRCAPARSTRDLQPRPGDHAADAQQRDP